MPNRLAILLEQYQAASSSTSLVRMYTFLSLARALKSGLVEPTKMIYNFPSHVDYLVLVKTINDSKKVRFGH